MFDQIIAGILTITTAVTGWFGFVPQSRIADLEQQVQDLQLKLSDFENISLGSFYTVSGKYYKLWGSGITSSATSLILTSFKIPVNDQEFAMGNFGEIGYGVIEPENSSNIEIISFSGISQDASTDKATLTGVSRGVNFVYPYNSSSTLAKSHPGGSRFIISDPSVQWGEFANKRNAETISGDWTFNGTSTPQYNSAPTFTSGSQEFCTVKFAEDQANAGAATASTSTKGIVTIANSEQRKNFTTSTYDGGQLIIRLHDFATSTDKHGATTTPVMTDTDGKIDQSFYNLAESWTWTASTTFNGTTTINATTTIGTDASNYLWVNASTTFTATSTFRNATTTFDRAPRIESTSDQATSTDFYSIATYGGIDGQIKNSFASATAMTWNQEQIATTSGIIVMSKRAVGSCFYRMELGVSPSTPYAATGTIVAMAANTDASGPIGDTISFAVPKNFYWYASSTVESNVTYSSLWFIANQ